MPGCQDYDRDFIHMPVCEHMVPIKFQCGKCSSMKFEPNTAIHDLNRRLEILEDLLNNSAASLKYTQMNLRDACKKIEEMEDYLSEFTQVIKAAESAESLFASKVHDLKSIDKKRDDVIDALCQKIARLETEISLIRVTMGQMIFKE